jgi:error-prone DNA polymerase
VEVGALDSVSGGLTRRDLLLQVSELHRRQGRVRAGQLPLDAERPEPPAPSGLPEMTAAERLGAELSVLGMDASRHLMDDHYALLRDLGATSARRLADAPDGARVLVAGAKAATQTPPVRSGRRVIFTTLDDGTGLVDCAFFEDSHAACAHTVFHSWLLLVRGTVKRRGPRSLSVVGAVAWNLADLAEAHRAGGLPAVRERLAAAEERGAERHGAGQQAARPEDARTLELSTGYRMSPWADLKPAGDQSAAPGGRRRMWHSSPGSAG